MTHISADVEDVVAAAEQHLRLLLPHAWVDAIDSDDLEALGPIRSAADGDELWRRIAQAGYVTPTWPRVHGGLGLPSPSGAAISRLLGKYRMPTFKNSIGVDLVGPALRRWGTDAQQARFLPLIATNREIWCQLFSEPGSGSDLVGLACRASRDGASWIINGQKVWTSFGEISSFGLLLARSNPGATKHRGITAFLIPMDRPGISVRPIRQITGEAEFSEVFFDEVEIDDESRLGPVDEGWRVATSVLMNERKSVSAGSASLPGTVTGRSISSLIRRHAPTSDPILRQRLAQAYIEDRVVTLTNQRAADRRRAGEAPGPEGSITKLYFSHHTQRLQELAVDLEGPAAQAWCEDDRWQRGTAWSMLRVRSKTIAGGTSEVQRNILGERVLGLPKEPEIDRDVPWSEVCRS